MLVPYAHWAASAFQYEERGFDMRYGTFMRHLEVVLNGHLNVRLIEISYKISFTRVNKINNIN